MPTHPPRSEPAKKIDILARREIALRRTIADGDDLEKLQRAAEAVRLAQLNLLKAKLASLRYRKNIDAETHPGAKIERDVEQWRKRSVEEIVALYRIA